MSIRYILQNLGRFPTLLQASQETGFQYEIQADSSLEIGSFVGMTSPLFRRNLMLLDTHLPEMISFAMIYLSLRLGNTCSELVRQLEIKDPLKYDTKGIYTYKITQFLRALALGMSPKRSWPEKRDGILIGNALWQYDLYHRDELERYVLQNASLLAPEKKMIVPDEQGVLHVNLQLAVVFG